MRPTEAPVGWVEQGAHHFPVRVYFEDTDAGQVVYHATYLRYAERARTEFLRASGAPHAEFMAGEGLVFVVRSVAVEYLRPARLDDSLLVVSRVVRLGGASVGLDQVVWRGADRVATLAVGLVAMGLASGRPERIPARWRAVFAALLAEG